MLNIFPHSCRPKIVVKAAEAQTSGARAAHASDSSHHPSDCLHSQKDAQKPFPTCAPKGHTSAAKDESKGEKTDTLAHPSAANWAAAGLDLGYASSSGSEAEEGAD
jgi:hypothetical protein